MLWHPTSGSEICMNEPLFKKLLCLFKLKNKKPCCPRSHRQRSKQFLKGARLGLSIMPSHQVGRGWGQLLRLQAVGVQELRRGVPACTLPSSHYGAPQELCLALQAPVGGAQGQRLINAFLLVSWPLSQASGPQPRDDLFTELLWVSRLGKGQRLGGLKGLGRKILSFWRQVSLGGSEQRGC